MAEITSGASKALEVCISAVRKVLSEHDDYLRGNETTTRALVIDEILTALGWDIKDPCRVRLEHRANNNKVDYVLLSSKNEFLVAVEAKPADSGPKENDRRQASGYAIEIGARYAVLTTGGRWEAWEMARTPRKDNVFVEVHLTTGDLPELTLRLGKLHRELLDC